MNIRKNIENLFAESLREAKATFYSNFIDREQLLKLAHRFQKSGYGEYLKRLAEA